MLVENNAALDDFMYYKEKEYPLGNEKRDGEDNQRDLIAKSSNNKRLKDMFFRYTSQDRLFENELLSLYMKLRLVNKSFPLINLYQTSNIITRVFQTIIYFIHLMISWTMH